MLCFSSGKFWTIWTFCLKTSNCPSLRKKNIFVFNTSCKKPYTLFDSPEHWLLAKYIIFFVLLWTVCLLYYKLELVLAAFVCSCAGLWLGAGILTPAPNGLTMTVSILLDMLPQYNGYLHVKHTGNWCGLSTKETYLSFFLYFNSEQMAFSLLVLRRKRRIITHLSYTITTLAGVCLCEVSG